MAKTIKFNLILDGIPIRDIEGLQDNFCIEDILEFYKKGLLQKWLEVRGFDKYLAEVETIQKDKNPIYQLLRIFDIEKSEREVKEVVCSLQFWEDRKAELEDWHKKDTQMQRKIADYHDSYNKLKEKISENKEDMPFMKTAVKKISSNFLEIFKIDYQSFFEDFRNNSPLVIYAILMNEHLRTFFLDHASIKSIIEPNFTLGSLTRMKSDYYSIFSVYNGEMDETEAIMEIEKKTALHTFKGTTSGCWKNLEIASTKVMVLSISNETFIRNANKPLEELSEMDVKGNFLILDGLVFKSNSAQKQIVYMEV